jgi:hypothetical protein
MPVAFTLYNVTNGTVDSQELLDDLPGYESTEQDPDVEGELKTDIADVGETSRGVEAVVQYDEPLKIGHRPGEPSHVKNTLRTRVRFVEEFFNGGFVIIGPKRKRKKAASKVADILDIEPDDYQREGIPSGSIAAIVGEDSIDSSFGWWKDIDANTSSASVQGDIEDSTHAQDISDDGRIVWVIFTSERYGGKVGVSTGNVVFYGEDWTHDRSMNYINDFIIDKV